MNKIQMHAFIYCLNSMLRMPQDDMHGINLASCALEVLLECSVGKFTDALNIRLSQPVFARAPDLTSDSGDTLDDDRADQRLSIARPIKPQVSTSGIRPAKPPNPAKAATV